MSRIKHVLINDFAPYRLQIPTTDQVLFDAACYWLKNNTEVWRGWMPLTWNCPAGTAYIHSNNECRPCVNDTIAAVPGTAACVPCLVGYGAVRDPTGAYTRCEQIISVTIFDWHNFAIGAISTLINAIFTFFLISA